MGICKFCPPHEPLKHYEGTLEDHLNKIHSFDAPSLAKYFAIVEKRLEYLEGNSNKRNLQNPT